MARARNIKPGFFKNEDLAECTLAARLCFAGLWTLADRAGRLEDRPKRIKGELFPFDAFEVEPLLDELVRHGFIERYVVGSDRIIQIIKFSAHQTPHHTEKASVLASRELQEMAAVQGGKTPGVLQESNGESPETDALQEEGRHEAGSTPGVLQEDSRSEVVLKGGSLPPDSLIHRFTDSPNPEEDSVPDGTAAAAQPPPASKPMTAKDEVWALGIPLLGDTPAQRKFLGGLAGKHSDEVLAEALGEAVLEKPIDPKPWLIATCKAKSARLQPAETRNESFARHELADPKPKWALDAGFPNRFEAENEGCLKHNAFRFRDGRRIQ